MRKASYESEQFVLAKADRFTKAPCMNIQHIHGDVDLLAVLTQATVSTSCQKTKPGGGQ